MTHTKTTRCLFILLTLSILLIAPKIRAEMPSTYINIDLSKSKLVLFDQNKKVKTYRIAIGRDMHETPTGDMSLSSIVWNPWWHPPKDSQWAKTEVDMPSGPRNPMGVVKMPIGGRIYIHGTNAGREIRLSPTHGCIRLSNASVTNLAKWLQAHFAKNLNETAFKDAMAQHKEELTVPLNRSIPVYVRE
jgi:lipoprotein-anchoring transpeptidase ErfK/SrfK